MGLNLKKMPGVKQLRGVKDKAVIKLVKEVDDSRKEKEVFLKQLRKSQKTAQSLIDQMSELIADLDDSNDVDEMYQLLTRNNPEYDKQVAIILDCRKKMKDYAKKVQRLEKVEAALLKLASRDATLRTMLAG